MVHFEKELLDYLHLPSVPKKEWNRKTSFKDGVAIVKLSIGDEAYAVCTFNAEIDSTPRIKKVFSQVAFSTIEKVFVVPNYMDIRDIQSADLDEQSKQAAKRLAEEAQDLEDVSNDDEIKLPENEYIFDHIHNDEEAIAFITAYNRDNNIRGSIPTKHDTILMRLSVIYSDLQKKNK